MTSHTPGPWQVAEIPIDDLWICEENDPGHNVGICFPEKRDTLLETMANARLIAAAPDLLEALKEAAEEVIACGGELRITLDGSWLSKALDAINKATGVKS